MKSLMTDGRGNLKIVTVDKPAYQPWQARVRVLACGVCNGTDRKLIEGKFKGFDTYPALLGHEGVGQVIEVGSEVKRFKPGDRVLLPFLEEAPAGYHSGWGSFSEHAIVGDHEAAARLGRGQGTPGYNEAYHAQTIVPEGIDAADATMIVTFREVLSAMRRFRMHENQSIVIFGAGPVAHCFTRFAKLLGMGPVVTLVNEEEKKQAAWTMGADEVLNSRCPSDLKQLRTLQAGGFDHVVDAVGSNELINLGLPLLSYNGTFCCYGIASQTSMNLDWTQAAYNFNVHFVQWPSKYEEFLANECILNWIEEGILKPKDFIHEVLPFEQAIAGFEKVRQREIRGKLVLTFE